jgi:uncharacterized Zn finger protein
MGRSRWGRDRYESYWPSYVPVAQRRAKAAAQLQKLQKKGEALEPVVLAGSKLAHTFWGKAWCDNLLRYSDFSNRMPRGRSYVRNGHVLDLRISQGKVSARVAGTRLYTIDIAVEPVAAARWKAIRRRCAGGIDSLVALLQGKLSPAVMEVITCPGEGLFPEPQELELSCSCPDWAVMCKHVAAALYGVGARLDQKPELLFLLRGVDHLELIGEAIAAPLPAAGSTERVLAGADLSGLFGIEVEGSAPLPARRAKAPSHPAKVAARAAKDPARAAKASASSSSPPAAALAKRYELLLASLDGRVARRIRRIAERDGLAAAVAEMKRLR